MSEMDLNDELEHIRKRKMEELLGISGASPTPGKAPHAAGGVTVLTDATFDSFVAGNGVSLVDFWAPWCGPCRMVSPVVEKLAGEYAGRIAFGKVNVDENPSTSSRFNIMGIPTLLIFRNGKPVDSIVGALPKAAIAQRLNRFVV